MSAVRVSQPVVLGPAVVFRSAPLRRHQPLMLQAMQRRVERPLLHLEHILRNLAVSVQSSVLSFQPSAFSPNGPMTQWLDHPIGEGHSYLSATIGSTFVARRAGM